jgi:hypothetical protein
MPNEMSNNMKRQFDAVLSDPRRDPPDRTPRQIWEGLSEAERWDLQVAFVEKNAADIAEIKFDDRKPNETDLEFYVRSGERFFRLFISKRDAAMREIWLRGEVRP